MPLRFIIARILQNVPVEKWLTDSRVIRRLAQITVYQWHVLSERFNSSGSLRSVNPGRLVRRFLNNIREEIRQLDNKKK
ncbi:hypothetical protein EMCRGX_G003538 [Ephydatia muelleri]|eukprot:Em0001g3425a